MKKKYRYKKRSDRIKLTLIMSAIVFTLIAVSAIGMFSAYALIRIVPFLDIEKLPRHSGTYILGIISLLIGVVLSILFRNYVLIPLHHSYTALDKVADGDFDVRVHEKGYPCS